MPTQDRLEQFTRDDLTFEVVDSGPIDGSPVVLLHGFPEDHTSYDPVLPMLHEAGLRTLTFDQRGYAPGARPPKVSDYRGDELVADVLALADAAGLDRFHLVGHDWGGGVAWQVAQQAPQRLATLTVLATPHPGAMARVLPRSDQALRSWYMGAFQLPVLPELLGSRRMEQMLTRNGLSPEHARRYAKRFNSPESLRGPINWYRALLRPARGGKGKPTAPVQVPTTYVWGNQDFALGRAAAEATKDHVTGDYRFIELDANHWLPENEPREVATAIIGRVSAA